ncbi:CD209 antigen-like protein E isoform X2 [Dicentrarchus labrax]|uniref:CD209 antigen-like protein E isoform X2 n=1 Tax=Dicentrarchus labrax TaxID=13489 RepID=UPI001632FF19|nr:CD209 antigen-like protein E isoform X2 [Dicentrarchus labrax]
MDNSQSEPEKEMSFEQKISQTFNTDGFSGSRHQTRGRGLFMERGGSAFPHHRLVILSLGLLNAVLLIATVVIGIYCAKAQDIYLQVPDSAATPLIIEMNYLRNHSGIIRAKLEAQAALAKQRASHVQVKMEVKQQQTLTDSLQRQIETLHTEKTNLLSEKTSLEENCGRCLPGWILLKSSCYYFSSRQVSNSKKNWSDSRAHCNSQGGDLLVINNLEEQLRISDNYPKQSSGHVWWQNGFWIGLTDVVTKGTWVWVNNVTEVETMYWRDGQPVLLGPQGGNCAALYHFGDSRKTWYNGNCHSHQYNWICEMEPQNT